MSSSSAIFPAMAPSLPLHCSPTTPFLAELSSYFHTCIPTHLALLSTTLGTLSIVSWLFAQLPQIYKNYQIQSTAGLSIFFLVEWCLGDATNLLGALFTNQAGWQVVVAGYYVFVDVCLVWQYFWYTYFKPAIDGRSLHSSDSSDRGDDDDVDSINGLSPINSHFRDGEWPSLMIENSKENSEAKDPETSLPTTAPRFSEIAFEKAAPKAMSVHLSESSTSSWMPSPSPRTLLYISTSCALLSRANAAPTPAASLTTTSLHSLAAAESPTQIAGTILSWLSTVLYLGSRVPQLYHNFTRKSTAGLSPLLFIAAFYGNFFYSSSLLTNPNAWNDFPAYGGHGWAGPQGSIRWRWVRAAAPFWLGAAGVLLMDGMMGVQFLLYGESDEEKVVKVRDSQGRSHWERVSGWMRGWVPSVRGKEKLVGLGESQRLIRESRELERSRYGSI
jgi:solute carrier family 66 (lysosomal lysine-arginine transporter), member 1